MDSTPELVLRQHLGASSYWTIRNWPQSKWFWTSTVILFGCDRGQELQIKECWGEGLWFLLVKCIHKHSARYVACFDWPKAGSASCVLCALIGNPYFSYLCSHIILILVIFNQSIILYCLSHCQIEWFTSLILQFLNKLQSVSVFRINFSWSR